MNTEYYSILYASSLFNLPVSVIEHAIKQGGIKVLIGDKGRAVRASDVQRLAESMQGGGR